MANRSDRWEAHKHTAFVSSRFDKAVYRAMITCSRSESWKEDPKAILDRYALLPTKNQPIKILRGRDKATKHFDSLT